MTKHDIIDHLTNNCGLHRSSAIRAVDGMVNVIADSLARGEAVTLRGFATIKPVNRAAKVGRNMATGEAATIPAHRTAKLVISKELKDKLNHGS